VTAAQAPTALVPSVARSEMPLLFRLTRSAPVIWLRGRAPILAVLTVQSALSLRLSNTAFQDEALYLYAGHREIDLLLHGTPTYDDYAGYFSGAPWFYPVIGGAVDGAGGLLAARALALVLMLGATVLLAGLTRRLFDRNAGILAAGVFAVAGPTLFMSRLATYDAPAVFLLALATWIAVISGRRSLLVLWTAAPVLVAAVAIKYAALLFVPTVLGIGMLAAVPWRGWWRSLLRAVSLAGLIGGLAGLVVAVAGSQFVRGVRATTTARGAGTDTVGAVVSQSAGYVAVPLLLALAGLVLAVRAAPARARFAVGLLGLLLTGTALLAPTYQAHLHTLTSLQKHAGYGLLFAAPLAGHALARMVGAGARDPRRLGLALAACLLLTTIGVRQSEQRFHDWPDASPLVSVLRTQARPVTGHYLVEESEVPRYYLRDIVQPYQWTGTYYFEYRTPDGRRLTGVPAYLAAIDARYFDVIALRYGPTAGLDLQIDGALRAHRGYEQIAQVPADSSYGSGAYTVWRAVH
jgi:hypothetical protein